MEADWESEFFPMPEEFAPANEAERRLDNGIRSNRIDGLLPIDEETGAVSSSALQVYLQNMTDMVGREGHPLSVIALSVDDSPAVRFFGAEGATLIGRAVVRGVRQESRAYDVVGRMHGIEMHGIPTFLIICPFLSEDRAAALAQRFSSAMLAHSERDAPPWLTVSCGVVSMALEVMDAPSLIARAEAALNAARRRGAGCVWKHSDTVRRLIDEDTPEP